MIYHHYRNRPARRCQDVQYVAGPHEGCAEFAAPVQVSCVAAATHTAKATDPEDRGLKFAVCGFHVPHYRAAGFRVFRFRRLAGARR